jgi:hypothetical protein
MLEASYLFKDNRFIYCYGLDMKYPPKSSCVEGLVPAAVFRGGALGR